MSRAARVARNVSWTLLGQGAIAAANFLLIPRLVRGFGTEEYGLYVLMFAAANYVQLFTFSASAASMRYAAERGGAGDGRGVRDALRYGLFVQAGGAALGGLLLWAAAPWAVTRFFQVPARLAGPGAAILRLAALGAVFAAAAQWAQSSLQGFQRFDRQSLAAAAQGILMPAGVAVLLLFGKGLRAAGIWYVLVCAGAFALALLLLRGALPPEARQGGGPGLPLREFLRYGLGMWLGPIAWIVSNQFDKLFIARSLALTALTLYAVPAGLLQRLQVLPAAVSTVLLPVVSEVRGDGAREDLRAMYARATRLLAGLLIPAYLLLFVLMPQFLSLWLGGRFGAEGVWPARVLVAANAAALLLFVPNAVAAGRGKSLWVSGAAWGQAAASLALWPLLIPRLGILGAALAALAAQLLPAFFYLRAVHRLLDLRWARYLRDSLGPAFLAGAVLLALVFPFHALAGGWLGMIGLSAAGLVLYAAVLWSRLPGLDRDFLRSRLAALGGA